MSRPNQGQTRPLNDPSSSRIAAQREAGPLQAYAHAYLSNQHDRRPHSVQYGPPPRATEVGQRGPVYHSQSGSVDNLATILASTQLSRHNDRIRAESASPTSASPIRDKPLPALPPARTPSQVHHQRQNQSPYHPGSNVQRLQALPPRVLYPSSQDEHRYDRPMPLMPVPETHRPNHSALWPASKMQRPLSMPNFQGASGLPHPPAIRMPEARPWGSIHPNPWELQESAPSTSQHPPPRPPALGTSPTRPLPSSSSRLDEDRTSSRLNQKLIDLTEDDDDHVHTPSRKPARHPVPSTPPGHIGGALSIASAGVSSSPSASPGPSGFPTDPALAPAPFQCWGIKRDGTRCTRRVKPTGSSSGKAANNADDGSEEEFCFQHIKAINAPAGFVLPGQAQRYISFAEWLPSDVISDATQAKLRKAMEARPSAADRGEQGYIYIYELRAAGDDSHIVLKVGRAVNVFRRIDQWRAQCESKEPLLRSFQPSAPSQSFLAGAAAVHVPGIALAHRWEKLVHLELSDRGERSREQCESCGAVHKEIFRMKRAGGYEDMEGVVKKWMRFVQMVEQDSDSK